MGELAGCGGSHQAPEDNHPTRWVSPALIRLDGDRPCPVLASRVDNGPMEASSLPRHGGFAVPKPLLARAGDDRLVEQLRRGNAAAFEIIYDRYHLGLLSFCRHMLGSREEAEDALQHAFVAAHEDIVHSTKPIRLKAWLYTIARNRCLSILRARR